MSKKIYVGNIHFRVDEDTLRDFFAKKGDIQSVKIITDVATGRSKGFGFIEMTSDEDAEKAVSALNGTMLMGRPLTVNKARPQQAFRNRRNFRERQKNHIGEEVD